MILLDSVRWAEEPADFVAGKLILLKKIDSG